MSGIDLHQHLWPAPFQEALRRRREPSRLDGTELVTIEGAFPFDAAAHDPARRSELLTADDLDTAVLSLQPSLGIEALSSAERDELEECWAGAVLELVAACDGRFAAFSPWQLRDGFVGASMGASGLIELGRGSDLLDEADRRGAVVFVHPEAEAPVPPGKPDWWRWTTGYTAQMQAASLAWLGTGRERWPSVRIVFAMLAGGAPVQLERLTHRGVDVRSALDPNVFFDVATYGRRAIELCIETYGVEQLVYGSDTPVVDPARTLRAVRHFGDAVTRLLQIETPSTLLT
jgi:predicted TIM-barrel fold metal-dependent hydrolase